MSSVARSFAGASGILAADRSDSAEAAPAINHEVDFALGLEGAELAVVGLIVCRGADWHDRPESSDPLWRAIESDDGAMIAAVRLSVVPMVPVPTLS